jgi:hypothetical protein
MLHGIHVLCSTRQATDKLALLLLLLYRNSLPALTSECKSVQKHT